MYIYIYIYIYIYTLDNHASYIPQALHIHMMNLNQFLLFFKARILFFRKGKFFRENSISLIFKEYEN